MNIEKEYVDGLLRKVERLQAERDAAVREASELAMSIWRAEFQKISPNFELCDSPAGVVSQIDNMYAAMRAERDALAAQVEALRNVANDAIHFTSKRKDKVCADPMFVMQQLQNRIDATPQQHLAEIRAEAGRAGFIACFHQQNFINILDDQLETRADEYAAKVRQGGAE